MTTLPVKPLIPPVSPDLGESSTKAATNPIEDTPGAGLERDNLNVPLVNESFYPSILSDMITTVLQSEAYLFSDSEQEILRGVAHLDPSSRALFSRLLQRRDLLVRTNTLQYSDVPDPLASAQQLRLASYALLDDPSKLTWPDLLARLTLEELRPLMGTKAASGMPKATLIQSLLDQEFQSPPSSIPCRPNSAPPLPSSKAPATQRGKGRQLSLFNFTSNRHPAIVPHAPAPAAVAGPPRRNMARDTLRSQAEFILGMCVRLDPDVRALLERTALVYYRESPAAAYATPTTVTWTRAIKWTEGHPLTTAVLVRSGRRRYADYRSSRSPLWSDREQVVQYERAVRAEMEIDVLLESLDTNACDRGVQLGIEAWDPWHDAVRDLERLECLGIEMAGCNSRALRRFHPGWPWTRVLYKSAACLARLKRHAEEAKILQVLLDQRVLRPHKRGEWYDRLALVWMHYAPSNFPPSPWPSKSSKATQASRQRALEISVAGLEDPMTHPLYLPVLQRRVKRLESTLRVPFSQQHDFSHLSVRQARTVTFKGRRLDRMAPTVRPTFWQERKRSTQLDPPPLQKRVKVERRTSAPLGPVRALSSTSIKTNVSSPTPSTSGIVTPDSESSPEPSEMHTYRTEMRKSMGTWWRGLDGEGCRVEELVLQHYVRRGYKGTHCEGGMITMLMAMLLWDILFYPIKGALQTPYQVAPYDLRSREFVLERQPLLADVLRRIRTGEAPEILRAVDDRERTREPWVVGCNWSYERDDLVELAMAFGPESLAGLCEVYASDWGHSCSGLPDLCLWTAPTPCPASSLPKQDDPTSTSLSPSSSSNGVCTPGKVRLVEVKGPGDQLRENQKRWIDLLCTLNIPVEVAIVSEEQ